MQPNFKKCKKCGSSYPETSEFFAPHPQCKNGLHICRSCKNDQMRAWKQRNAERISAQRRAKYAADNGAEVKAREERRAQQQPYSYSAGNLCSGVRDRTKELGIPCSPELRTKAYVVEWLKRQSACECCGVEFKIGRKLNGVKCDESPSFDRFDTTKGYTLGNTALVCWRCNNIKRNYTADDLEVVAKWIRSRGNEVSKFGAAA